MASGDDIGSGRRFVASCLLRREGGGGLADGSTSFSSRNAGGRAAPGTGPLAPMRQGAEAGEVDRRIEVPVDDETAGTAAVGAFGERELGSRSATGTQLARRIVTVRRQDRAAGPIGLVFEHRTDPTQRRIADCTVQSTFAMPSPTVHTRQVQMLHHEDVVLTDQLRCRVMYGVTAQIGYARMSFRDLCSSLPPTPGGRPLRRCVTVPRTSAASRATLQAAQPCLRSAERSGIHHGRYPRQHVVVGESGRTTVRFQGLDLGGRRIEGIAICPSDPTVLVNHDADHDSRVRQVVPPRVCKAGPVAAQAGWSAILLSSSW